MGKNSHALPNKPKQVTAMFLDEVEQGCHGHVTVMICRKWDVNIINGRYMSTDFIVSDKKGNVMHCVGKGNIAHYFIDKLQEGSLYSLRDFTVQPNRDEYRIMKDNPYIIELQWSTIVAKSTDDVDDFLRYPFQLVPFEDQRPTEKK